MIETYLRQFEATSANGGATALPWLRQLRQRAIDRFQATGFPSPRDEEWRFTPLGPIVQSEFGAPAENAPVSNAELEPFLFGHDEWTRLVFIDGRYAPALSGGTPLPGVTVSTVAEAIAHNPGEIEAQLGRHLGAEETPFTGLNMALSREGAVVRVAKGTEATTPVHLLFVTTSASGGAAVHPRILVSVEREARMQMIESYVTLTPGASYLTNTVCEIVVGEGAWVEHSRIQRESESAYHVGFTQVTQARDSHYRSFSLAMGGAISRHNLHTRFTAPNTEALLYGLYIGRGDQLLDNHTAIYHDQPNCRSWEVYKGVLDERARGVFNGKIFVKPEAQKTDAKQTNRALLLSDSAKINTKPQLEIFADDVRCTHGATVGNLDQLAGFYLRSRGIPEAAARRILTYAFAAEVLDEIAAEPVRIALDRLVYERLGVAR